MPRVSILLPTHNRADVLGLAIQSVLDQSLTDFELLVVADGCTDGTVPLVAGIGDPRIRLFDLPKAPYFGYANRNIALREAKGDYVAFAAHDDLLLVDHLRLLVDRLDATGREWVYSRPLCVSTDGTIVPYATNLTIADELRYFLTVENTIPASCVVYRRSCLDRYGYWPEDVSSAADWRHWIAIIEGGGGKNIEYVATPTCLHFSAEWKQSRHSGVDEVRTWLDIAGCSEWWPDALRYAIPAGVPEQHVIAAAMRAGGAAWLAELRAAVDLVLSRLAWDYLRTARPLLRSRDLELGQLRAGVADVEQSLADARQTSPQLSHQAAKLDADCRSLQEALAAAEARSSEATAARDAAMLESARIERELRDTHAQLQAAHVQVQVVQAKLQAAYAQVQVVHEQFQAAHKQLQAHRERLSLTLASKSWRVTAPLRALRRLLTPRTRTSR
jgi:hypothetical protein